MHDERQLPVVVGVDGSKSARIAAAWAAEEAARRRAPLRIVHANLWPSVRPPPLDASTGGDWHRSTDWTTVQEGECRLLAERLAGWQEEFPDVKTARVVTRDRPVRSLLDAALHARLLVVGSRGRGGFTGMLLGSTSHALLHHCPCPVAVVRD